MERPRSERVRYMHWAEKMRKVDSRAAKTGIDRGAKEQVGFWARYLDMKALQEPWCKERAQNGIEILT